MSFVDGAVLQAHLRESEIEDRAKLSPEKVRQLRAAAVQYCYAAGIQFLTPAQCAALVALARRCGKQRDYSTTATWGQIAAGEGTFSVTTLRRVVRQLRQLQFILVKWTKKERDLNAPNFFRLMPALQRLADIALKRPFSKTKGWSKKDSPGDYDLIDTSIIPDPTSNTVGWSGQKSSPQHGVAAKAPTRQNSASGGRHAPPQRRAPSPSAGGTENCSGRDRVDFSDRPSRGWLDRDPKALQLAIRGLSLLAPGSIGEGASAEAVIAKTPEIARLPEFEAVKISGQELGRALQGRGLWAVLAWIETAIKVRTHTKQPILWPDRYFGRICWVPLTDRDPMASVEKTIHEHDRKQREIEAQAAQRLEKKRLPGFLEQLSRRTLTVMRRAAEEARAGGSSTVWRDEWWEELRAFRRAGMHPHAAILKSVFDKAVRHGKNPDPRVALQLIHAMQGPKKDFKANQDGEDG